jgi:hypothetical protein
MYYFEKSMFGHCVAEQPRFPKTSTKSNKRRLKASNPHQSAFRGKEPIGGLPAVASMGAREHQGGQQNPPDG